MRKPSFCSFRVLKVLALVFFAWQGAAAADFSLTPSYATGKLPVSVAVADLNGDGKVDLVVAFRENGVSVLLGNGDGTFQPHVDYSVPAGSQPSSVALADFNSDGKLDIVIANSGNNTVSVLLGNGDGTFQAPIPSSAGNKPSSVAVGDFNGDGKPDLAVADQSSNQVSILLGIGNGSFKVPVYYAVGTGPTSVAVADFNLDGKLDLAVANGVSNNISVLPGGGDGTFGLPTSYGVGNGTHPLSVAAGDFNGDGKPDLAVANNGQIWVAVLLGNGDGTFQAPNNQEAGTYPTGVAVGDFNGDGKLDLVVSNNGSNTLTVLLGKGDGQLSWVGNFDGEADIVGVAAGDFNGDGKLDAAVVNETEHSVSIFLGNGDGTLVAPVSYGIGGIPNAIAVGAFGTNALPDLVASNGSSGPICTPGCVSVIANKGNGRFRQSAANYDVGSSPKAVAVGDFTGNGEVDVVAANGGSNNVSVLLNKGAGSFDIAVNYSAGTNPVAVAVGDLNGDSKLDLVVANSGSNDLSVLLNNGSSSFQSPLNTPPGLVGTAPSSVAVGDFNGDGKLDVAVTNWGTAGAQSTVSVLLGNGDGTFYAALKSPVSVGVNPSSIVTGDFNGDGKMDLAVANEYGKGANGKSGTVSVLLGNGDGTFQSATSTTLGVNLLSITTGDVNGDGKLDLVVGSGGRIGRTSGVSVLLGKGDGTFRPAHDYNFGATVDSVAVADLNGDGAPDIAVTSMNAGVSVLLNPGGTFVTASGTPDPSSFGQTVTLTATVAASVILPGQAAPAGTVVFDDGQTAIGSASLVSGSATFTTSGLSVGTHTITAVYSGDNYFNPNTARPINQTVIQ